MKIAAIFISKFRQLSTFKVLLLLYLQNQMSFLFFLDAIAIFLIIKKSLGLRAKTRALNILPRGLATLLERANIKIFEVNFQNFFL